jgi:rhomboid family GlyGly-CTERM serine protease
MENIRKRVTSPSRSLASRHGFFAGLGALAILLQAVHSWVFVRLAYYRPAILRGEVWRLLTGHLVHIGVVHLFWNLAGVALAWVAFGPRLTARRWLIASLISGLGAGLGVLAFEPRVGAMAGLSGLLHGLMAAGALATIRSGERLGWLFLAVLTAKIVWEQLVGPTAATQAALGGAIAVGAHLYGFLGGLLAGVVLRPGPG